MLENTEDRTHTSAFAGEEENLVEAKIIDNTAFTLEPNGNHYKSFAYKGSNVLISKSNMYTINFICNFNWADYPFDSQLCRMELLLKNAGAHEIDLDESTISHLAEYSTFSLYLEDTSVAELANKTLITVSIRLERNFNPLLLNTYLPTFILTVINQLTNYFTGYELFEVSK